MERHRLQPQAMKEGLYTFWGYEHLMYLPTIDPQKTVADVLTTEIITTDARLNPSEMHVSRATDGGQKVIQNY